MMSRFQSPTVMLTHYRKSMQWDYLIATQNEILSATVIRSPIKMTTHTWSRTERTLLRKMTTRTWLRTGKPLPKMMTTSAWSQTEKQTRCSSRKLRHSETL